MLCVGFHLACALDGMLTDVVCWPQHGVCPDGMLTDVVCWLPPGVCPLWNVNRCCVGSHMACALMEC